MTSLPSEVPNNYGHLGSLALNRNVSALEPSPPVTLNQNETLRKGIETLKTYGIGCALIVNDAGELSGIISERDILFKWALSGIDADTIPLSDIMTSNPSVLNQDATIAAALYTMSQGGFRHIPVVNHAHQPVGLISVKDVMDFISMELMRNMFGA